MSGVGTDTIFALASGRPPAAIAIVRVSGPQAHEAGARLAGRLPPAREALLRQLRDPRDGTLLDQALVLRFDAPASATGEDVLEFHVHGGRAVVDAVLGALASIHGMRAAQPGEFTRRAFENGRIDLTEAEGLADLLEAETETQRRAALAIAEGGLRRQVELWQERLLALSARAEAAIDYAEEDGTDADQSLSKDCDALAIELNDHLSRPRIEPLRDGLRVVIAGPPNSGKSSLLNAISGLDRAIVTDIPGTTRDHIEVPLSIAGIAVVLTDTAGLRQIEDKVERLGVERSHQLIEAADVLIWLGDPRQAPSHKQIIKVHSRCDLPSRQAAPPASLAVSSKSGMGMAELLNRVGACLQALVPAEGALALNRRQAFHLTEAHSALLQAAREKDLVLLAETLRTARLAFNRLTGRAGLDEMMDSLFSRFCLGK